MLKFVLNSDLHDCPRHGMNTVTATGTTLIDGKPVARLGDVCDCGAVIVETSGSQWDDGVKVAFDGAMTSCGGKMIASATDEVSED